LKKLGATGKYSSQPVYALGYYSGYKQYGKPVRKRFLTEKDKEKMRVFVL